jgi:hypothetical protein
MREGALALSAAAVPTRDPKQKNAQSVNAVPATTGGLVPTGALRPKTLRAIAVRAPIATTAYANVLLVNQGLSRLIAKWHGDLVHIRSSFRARADH